MNDLQRKLDFQKKVDELQQKYAEADGLPQIQTRAGNRRGRQISREALNKSVTPAKAGVQLIENTGFRLSPTAVRNSTQKRNLHLLPKQNIGLRPYFPIVLNQFNDTALGSERFKDEIEATLARSIRLGTPGRPRKQGSDEEMS